MPFFATSRDKRALPSPPPRLRRRPFPFLLFLFTLAFLALVYHSLVPSFPKAGDPLRLYSNQTHQDLSLTFLRAIESAHNSIYLVTFGLSDGSILSALQTKYKERVALKVHYDPRGSSPPPLPSSILISHRHSGLMHQKILIIDDDLLLLGSANLTGQSLRMHDNLVAAIRSPPLALFLKKHPPMKGGHLRTFIGGQELEFYLLPDPKGAALQKLLDHLQGAESTIRIALFTITHPLIVRELIDACERGVKVELVIDASSSLGSSRPAVAALSQAGVEVKVSNQIQILHHKFAWIDEKTLLFGSANWTRAAFTKNSDLFLVIPHLNEEQASVLERIWSRIEHQSRPEMQHSRFNLNLPN